MEKYQREFERECELALYHNEIITEMCRRAEIEEAKLYNYDDSDW